MNTYLDVVGRLGGDPFALRADEFSWRVRYVAEWNAIRLRLLTALQRALPTSQAEDKAAQELKETLTNVIIMQTRLREREEALVQQLEEAAQSGAMRSVTVDASDARSVDEQLLAAQKHLQEIASG
ncbi:MAG: hypothetical protein EXR47_01770 [Dehalococcoidia bacterium]|nr:hypothetical protein [Dehalococcoidia bacterium]